MTWLRGLHAAMFERSADLAQLVWAHPGTGRERKGIGFYDYAIIAAARARTGLPPLPVIEITIDEAPVLLALKGAAPLILDILKLGRKVGFRVRLAAQVPSIAELGKGEIRSILNGGNGMPAYAGNLSSTDTADLVAFLASDDADYMTGQAIHANGGAYFGA